MSIKMSQETEPYPALIPLVLTFFSLILELCPQGTSIHAGQMADTYGATASPRPSASADKALTTTSRLASPCSLEWLEAVLTLCPLGLTLIPDPVQPDLSEDWPDCFLTRGRSCSVSAHTGQRLLSQVSRLHDFSMCGRRD